MASNDSAIAICIVINDKSQGSIAKNLACNELLFCTFFIQSVDERVFFKLVNIWRSYSKMADCFMCPIRLALLSSKMLISPDKLNNLCITEETVTYHCYVNRQISVSLLSINIKLL